MDAPQPTTPPLFIPSLSRYTAAWELAAHAGAFGALASGTWPQANRAIYVPLNLPFRYHAKRFCVANGAAVAGNFDIGIYSPGGTRIWSAGSTAQAGTTVCQYVSAGILLSPGAYYLALSLSSTSAQVTRANVTGNNAARMSGLLQEDLGSVALPATFNPVTTTSAFWPLFGFTMTSAGF